MKNKTKQMRNNKMGFTLIELLVVISIIGLLASIVMTNLSKARMKAMDARSLSDMHQIQLALDLYYDKYGRYPAPTPGDGSWEDSTEDNPGDFMEYLKNEDFLPTVPVDPINIGWDRYSYFKYGQGSSGCDGNRGNFYVLGVRNMKTTGRPHPNSPGWSCPNRNWNTEFDWVTGKFER